MTEQDTHTAALELRIAQLQRRCAEQAAEIRRLEALLKAVDTLQPCYCCEESGCQFGCNYLTPEMRAAPGGEVQNVL
jgi:hypothetical protein